MSKKIETLVEDIYSVFDQDITVPPEVAESFGQGLARIVSDRLRKRKDNYLRLSNLGSPCVRKLWYSINCPELGEKLSGPTRIKFLIGDITEAVILFLARVSGHDVTDEQKEVSIGGVKGHIDAIVDDELVDVKSASPYSFSKFKDGLQASQDSFGYLTQLGGYGKALGKTRGHFIAVNKVLGHVAVDTQTLPDINYEQRVEDVQKVLEQNEPPDRAFSDEPDGQSGNRKLGVACSYCAFRETCWPGLKTYDYSGSPRFLTQVKREPRVPQVTS